MTLTATFEHKVQKIRLTLLGIAFGITAFFPHYALAFEARAQDLRAPVDIINQTRSPKNDEFLLPQYTFSDTSTIVAATPVTIKSGITANTPVKQNRVAIILPTSTAPLIMEGEASYYSRAGCLGCNPLFVMANGQVLDDNALTMAIGADKVHLVGHTARVTSLATGKSVNVRITDTGGFYQDKYGNRVADLTIATKEAIGMRGGVEQVRVEVY